ncbi:hypothetical protein PV04_00232 [Phialophora macrospora]|uniref:Zn(2)-C6 fungal-type domain-containing protein n=1 Tax=Phialophora macrospora TaxID=1851006 RepID=A0A0D2FUF7_9EURO|nr:hypothetical protein PV04_00232 [Phialophora macrospora]
MPGVPSGRGCDACRRQKKKCDLSEHPCPRCRRLTIPCIGLGQRRFKFVHDDKTSTNNSHATTTDALRPEGPETEPHASFIRALEAIRIHSSPSNGTTRLAGAFADMIKPTVSIKYNLAWTYGDYLNHVPSRLGVNEALDSATDAFLTAVGTISEYGTGSTLLALEKYGRTLASLRKCLDDPVKARAPETLCAILFLWNCQQYLWMPEGYGRHAEGVAQIIRLRGCAETSQDPFESNLLLSLRAVVLFDSLFNGKVHFTDDEWVAMFNSQLYELSPEGQAVQLLTRVPNLMRRTRAALLHTLTGDLPATTTTTTTAATGAALPALQTEADALRNDFDRPLTKLRQRWSDYVVTLNSDPPAPRKHLSPLVQAIAHCHFLRTYALGLAIAIIINEVRLAAAIVPGAPTGARAPRAVSAEPVLRESHAFALEIIDLAALAAQYRPLGVNAVGICLVAAEIGAGDAHPATKLRARALRRDYARDFRGAMQAEVAQQQHDLEPDRLICGRDWAGW